ncbi:phage holin family protein [Bacillus sp. REN16]|uniref:phage holin family protein n=1 Tax=Bacillus sp. REN16 TaxID=2887296 RepID=UPI001E597D32|nr:phage holin family protein [Bacillus sp. REN16]MCC3358778.1 phage holin family protein [Bacillus sp. REN16]
MDLLQFLNENYYMLVPVLWVIGYFLKATPTIPNWSIAWILLGVSLVGGAFFYGFTAEALYNGVIAAGVAVFGHQLYKQTAEAKTKKI